MAGFYIRPTTAEDVPQLLDMVRSLAHYERAIDDVVATASDLTASLFPAVSEPSVWAHVAVQTGSGDIVGMAIWHLNFSTWEGCHGLYVEDLYVPAELRGQGIGKALLSTLASICRARGYSRLQLSVLDWNQPAVDAYRAMGGKPLPEWIGYRFEGQALDELAHL